MTKKIKIEPLYRFSTRQMTKKETNILLDLTLAEHSSKIPSLPEITGEGSPDNSLHTMMEIMDEDFSCKVIQNRLREDKLKVSPATVILCSVLAQGIPGRAVAWAYTLYCILQATGKEITLEHFCSIFPSGFPTEEAYTKMWQNQKGFTHDIAADNMLNKYSWEQLYNGITIQAEPLAQE